MPQIPVDASLRQFARAVAADRFVGDELVNAIIASRAFDHQMTRSEKFREFFERWRAYLQDTSNAKPFSNAEFVRGFGDLPTEGRLVSLLHDVCGLSQEEVSIALGPLSKPVDALVREERSAILASSWNATAVIVEDEPLIAADLQDVLESMGVKVVALARTAEQGARETLKHRPDIVLADFNLDGRKTGVDAVLAFQEEHSCPVVFITGYPDQVLRGDEIEPDFVIVKPYRPEAVQAAVAHCLDTSHYSVATDDVQPE